MSLESDAKNLILIVLAVLIAIFLWKAFWTLSGLLLFVLLAYIIYLFLKGRL